MVCNCNKFAMAEDSEGVASCAGRNSINSSR